MAPESELGDAGNLGVSARGRKAVPLREKVKVLDLVREEVPCRGRQAPRQERIFRPRNGEEGRGIRAGFTIMPGTAEVTAAAHGARLFTMGKRVICG